MKNTMIYMDFRDGKPLYYIRLVPIETPQFRHGISFATSCSSKEEAEQFQELIEEYLQDASEAIAENCVRQYSVLKIVKEIVKREILWKLFWFQRYIESFLLKVGFRLDGEE